MSENPECLHSQPRPVGYTEGPVQPGDAVMEGLVLFAGVFSCPDCGQLVVSVDLRPKARGCRAVLVTERLMTLRSSRSGGGSHD